MKKTKVIWLLAIGFTVLLLSASCSPSSIKSNTTPTYLSNNASATPKIPSINTVTPTDTVIPASPTKSKVDPKIVKYCPDKRDVSADKLEIQKSTGLLVKTIGDEDSSDAILSLTDGSLTKIPTYYSPSGSQYELIGFSFDGEWLAYITKNENGENFLLVTNLNNTKKWEYPVSVKNYDDVSWTEDKQILFFGQDGLPGRENRDVPLAIMNPYTGESHLYKTLSIPSDAIILSWSGDNKTVLYYYPYHLDKQSSTNRASFVLYDLTTSLSEEVLTWMEKETEKWFISDLDSLFLRVDQNRAFSLVYSKPYGFDFGDGLLTGRINEKQTYEQVMQPVILPGNQPDVQKLSTSNDLSRFYFVRFNGADYRTTLPVPLYFYDVKNNILGDYCIDLGYTGSVLRTYLSPDGRFLAWKDFGKEPRDLPLGTKILDTSNGMIASLPGYEVLDWIILK